jgi:hypothetical protein
MAHGARVAEAATEAPSKVKMPKVLQEMALRKGQTGGAVAEHMFTHYEHKPEVHVFGASDGAKLAAHIEQHLGLKMPGRAEGTIASPADGEAGE